MTRHLDVVTDTVPDPGTLHPHHRHGRVPTRQETEMAQEKDTLCPWQLSGGMADLKGWVFLPRWGQQSWGSGNLRLGVWGGHLWAGSAYSAGSSRGP